MTLKSLDNRSVLEYPCDTNRKSRDIQMSRIFGSFWELLKQIFKKPERSDVPPPMPFIKINSTKWAREEADGKVQVYSNFAKEIIERQEAKDREAKS